MNDDKTVQTDRHSDYAEYNPVFSTMWERILEARSQHVGCCVPGPTSD